VNRSLGDRPDIEQVLSPEKLVEAQAATREVFVDRAVNEYAVALVGATRRPGEYGVGDIAPFIEFGASPRGSINLIHGGRALALLRGRGFVLPDDVRALALDVLRHRLVLTYEALAEGVDADALLSRVIAAVPVPEVTLSRSEVA
jgi:MoxR-like ATPase